MCLRLVLLIMIQCILVNSFSRNSRINKIPLQCHHFSSQPQELAYSRHGLDPAINHVHAPLVYHENYSFANWPENHTFPVGTCSMYLTCTVTKYLLTAQKTSKIKPNVFTLFHNDDDDDDNGYYYLSTNLDEQICSPSPCTYQYIRTR